MVVRSNSIVVFLRLLHWNESFQDYGAQIDRPICPSGLYNVPEIFLVKADN
jgi:hypothetical protein